MRSSSSLSSISSRSYRVRFDHVEVISIDSSDVFEQDCEIDDCTAITSSTSTTSSTSSSSSAHHHHRRVLSLDAYEQELRDYHHVSQQRRHRSRRQRCVAIDCPSFVGETKLLLQRRRHEQQHDDEEEDDYKEEEEEEAPQTQCSQEDLEQRLSDIFDQVEQLNDHVEELLKRYSPPVTTARKTASTTATSTDASGGSSSKKHLPHRVTILPSPSGKSKGVISDSTMMKKVTVMAPSA